MRLFKKGSVGYNSSRHVILLDTVIPSGPPAYFGARKLTHGQKYILSKDETLDFQKFWQSIKRIDVSYRRNQNLYLSIERFNSSYGKVTAEDKFLDFAISLEALLSKTQER